MARVHVLAYPRTVFHGGAAMSAGNVLFYGDNLDVLRGRYPDGSPYVPDESVDLVYL